MTFKRFLFLLTSFTLLNFSVRGELSVGVAVKDITPPEGTPMAGYYHVRLSEGTHNPLMAKAIVLEEAGTRVALVACDLVSVPASIVEQARLQVEELTTVPGGSVMISATHSHTGPVTSVEGMERAGGAAAERGKKYLERLPRLIAEVVRDAEASLQPARVRAARGNESRLSFNRRFLMKDGSVGWNPGKLNPDIVRPVGPIDPEVPIVVFERKEDHKPLALFVNFALHLDTVGGQKYSADYPYTVSSILSEIYGPDMVTFFTMGASGNVNHINVKSGTPQKGHGEAARIGTVLAGEILESLKELEVVDSAPLQVSQKTLKLALPKIDPGEVDEARRIAAKYGKPGAAPFLDMVHAFKVIDTVEREGKPVEAEVEVITLGEELAWVGLPGEIFVELGLAIKLASPFPYTIVSTLTNGSHGYFPNLKAFVEGNYEPVSARTSPGSGERFVETATQLLVDHYGEAHPQEVSPILSSLSTNR